jgi:hypothetical protein
MRKILVTLGAISCLSLFAISIHAQAKEETWTGVLIDNACGDKQADEAAAAKHPIACCKKEACAASGYQLVVGSKHVKFTDKGNDVAKAYLEKGTTTKVVVMGTMAGDKVEPTSIKAAEAK